MRKTPKWRVEVWLPMLTPSMKRSKSPWKFHAWLNVRIKTRRAAVLAMRRIARYHLAIHPEYEKRLLWDEVKIGEWEKLR
jgi:hypothetical protein